VETSLARTGQALAALLLGLRLCPAIRHQEGSGPAGLLAQGLRAAIAREAQLFQGDSSAVLLLLDRREDPVTPLLSQWTYQAMVHELVGITNNRVSLAGAPGVAKDLQDVVLSSSQDEF
jgi:vacuolar protein sorting-associated protein 45